MLTVHQRKQITVAYTDIIVLDKFPSSDIIIVATSVVIVKNTHRGSNDFQKLYKQNNTESGKIV